MINSRISSMSGVVCLKSVSHCVNSKPVIQDVSQYCVPRRPEVTLEGPHGLDGAGSANEGSLACVNERYVHVVRVHIRRELEDEWSIMRGQNGKQKQELSF